MDTLSAQLEWSDNSANFKDITDAVKLPTIVRVSKGQYRNIGVSKSVTNELYLHSIQSGTKVLAQGVKQSRDGKRLTTCEHKYSLPMSYAGWFELLSENGRPVKALQSVAELAKASPNRCLVRESVKAYLGNESGELTLDRTRSVASGEQLTLLGEVTGQSGRQATKKRLLRCQDAKKETIYLNCEQRGLFSPIAGHGNISGVHNIQALLQRFRLPVLVRLVHGIIPTKMSNFTGVFRLVSQYTDQTAFVCPLARDAKLVPISTREPLRLQTASNFETIYDSSECHQLAKLCRKQVQSYVSSIHVLVSLPDSAELKPVKSPLSQKKLSVTNGIARAEENSIFEEIDDIYDYVRTGGEPPPSRQVLSKSTAATANNDYWEEKIYEPIDGEPSGVKPATIELSDESDDEPTKPVKGSTATEPTFVAIAQVTPGKVADAKKKLQSLHL